MKFTVICVGKVKEPFFRDLIEEYGNQIKGKNQLEIIEVPDEQTKEHASETEIRQVLDTEGKRIERYLVPGYGRMIVALAIGGKQYSTEEWTRELEQRRREEDLREVVFVIGGSLGLSEGVLRKADVKLSFSRLTFPHQFMRVMLLEAIHIWQKDYL